MSYSFSIPSASTRLYITRMKDPQIHLVGCERLDPAQYIIGWRWELISRQCSTKQLCLCLLGGLCESVGCACSFRIVPLLERYSFQC